MLIDTDNQDDSDEPEYITDPLFLRYASRLDQLAYELAEETKDYTLNREQIEQLLQTLFTLRTMLRREKEGCGFTLNATLHHTVAL